ncbi:MAG: hypothetical protein Q8K17_00280, partial [Pseudohongiella sp.]|nr:hypothetical protein [Pseudohongiella sp.]
MRIEETATKGRIENTSEAWEEGALGRDEQYVQVSDENLDSELDASLGLQLISIRLQKSLIEDFKMIAQYHGDIGYQTLMRQILRRFATSEAKRI